MTVDLGFMEFELLGPTGIVTAAGGFAVGCIATILLFQLGSLTGPAAKSEDFADACRMPMLATLAWCLAYYNMIGSAVWSKTAIDVFKMIDPSDVNKPQFLNVVGRFAGNTADHALTFLPALWLYTIFVDYGSAGVLGFAYVAQRLLYPFMYMVQGEFNFYFEFITQAGYGFIGCMLLGILVQGLGGDWTAAVASSPVMYPALGWMLGSFSMFPGLPLAPIYTFIHYKTHHALHWKPGLESGTSLMDEP